MTDNAKDVEPDDDTATNGAKARPRVRKIDAIESELEGLHKVSNNAFNASGAALLLAILALGLAVFLLVRGGSLKGMMPGGK